MEHLKKIVIVLSFVCQSFCQMNPWFYSPSYQPHPYQPPVFNQPVYQQSSFNPCQHVSSFGYAFNNPCPTYFNQPVPNPYPIWSQRINPINFEQTTSQPVRRENQIPAVAFRTKRISAESNSAFVINFYQLLTFAFRM